jgi:hypothetical protein
MSKGKVAVVEYYRIFVTSLKELKLTGFHRRDSNLKITEYETRIPTIVQLGSIINYTFAMFILKRRIAFRH